MGGLVISDGRVVAPASGMDAIGDVAVMDGQIAALPDLRSSDLNVKQLRHVSAASRRVRPSFARNSAAPRMKRAQGRPGTGWHPWSACSKKHAAEPQAQPRIPGLPCANGFNGFLRALPGDEFLFVTVATRIE